MNEYKRSEILSGLFVVLALFVFSLFAFKVGDFNPFAFLEGKRVKCVTHLTDIQGLAEGAMVAVAGHEVGRVTSLTIVPKTLTEEQRTKLTAILGEEAADANLADSTRQVVEVTFELRSQTLSVNLDSAHVFVTKQGFLGTDFLALDPGLFRGELTPIASANLTEPLVLKALDGGGLDQLINQLGPVVGRIQSILQTLDEEVFSQSNMSQISTTLETLKTTTDEVRKLVNPEDAESFQGLVVRPLNQLLLHADESVVELKERLLSRTLSDAESLLSNGSKLITSLDEVSDRAGKSLASVSDRAEDLLKSLDQTAIDLSQSMQSLEKEIASVVNTTDELLSSARPDLLESLRRIRRTTWEAEMTMRKIRSNPAYLLFGDEEPDLSEREFDGTQLRQSGRARPYRQRDETDDGR